MFLDVRTLFVANAATTMFVGFALFYYRAQRKVYPGFNYWMLGSLIVSLSYVATFLRGSIPELLSILIVNGGFVLSGVIRLDGVLGFSGRSPLHRSMYALPLVAMGCAAYYTLLDNDMTMRLVLLTVWICPILWVMAWLFLFQAPQPRRSLHRVAGVLTFCYGMAMLLRTLFYVENPPHQLFQNAHFNSLFFLYVLMFEIFSGLLIMMVNNQRMEEELTVSHQQLQEQVASLEQAMSEVKVLKGLLPICATCKKIRDDQGYWNQLETYIHRHSEATFTHGTCPDCAVVMEREIEDFLRRHNGHGEKPPSE